MIISRQITHWPNNLVICLAASTNQLTSDENAVLYKLEQAAIVRDIKTPKWKMFYCSGGTQIISLASEYA